MRSAGLKLKGEFMTTALEKIREAARESGFGDCGIIAPERLDEFTGAAKRRMANVPESAGFYQGLLGMADVRSRFPWAKSLVVCTYEFGRFRYPAELRGRYAKSFFSHQKMAEPMASIAQVSKLG